MLEKQPNLSTQATEIVGAQTHSGVWFLTKGSSLHSNYTGTGTILDLAILLVMLPIAACEYFRSPSERETETVLGHSGSIFCTRTEDEIVFIAYETASGTPRLTKVLRRFPSSTLESCHFEDSHNTAVEFNFSCGESFTLRFEGVWSDLAEFIRPGSSIKRHPENGR